MNILRQEQLPFLLSESVWLSLSTNNDVRYYVICGCEVPPWQVVKGGLGTLEVFGDIVCCNVVGILQFHYRWWKG